LRIYPVKISWKPDKSIMPATILGNWIDSLAAFHSLSNERRMLPESESIVSMEEAADVRKEK